MFELLSKIVDLISGILERRAGGKVAPPIPVRKQETEGATLEDDTMQKLPKFRAEDPTLFIRKKP